eukprot:SAG11_NODE_2806_length_2950_cov_9.723957_1_plen_112_part_00
MAALDQAPETFTFHHMPEVNFAAVSDAALTDLLSKWGLVPHLKLHSFRYDQYYQPHMHEQLLMDLLNDKEVQAVFQPTVKGGGTAPFGTVSAVRSTLVSRNWWLEIIFAAT